MLHPNPPAFNPHAPRCDATREVELSAAHEIEGYPTLIWYFRGEMTRYSGTSFSTADMTSWIVDMGRLSKAWGSTPRSVLDHTLAFSLPNPKAVHLTAATFEAQVYDPSRTGNVQLTRVIADNLYFRAFLSDRCLCRTMVRALCRIRKCVREARNRV